MMSLDVGTTSSRALLFDRQGMPLGMSQKELTQYYPATGLVEHDPLEIWSVTVSVMAEVLAKTGRSGEDLAGIGITNQRETTLIWDRGSGKPIYPAIVWQDRRTSELCDHIKSEGEAGYIQQKTGLIPDAYFSATKIQWLLDHVEGARERAVQGDLCFGTIDSWILWKLTGGKVHATDISNASRTMLFNLHNLEWDEELLVYFDIPESLLPEVRSSSEYYGHTLSSLTGVPVPVAGIAGDQQSALFGQQCLSAGMVKNTYGTGCFTIMHTGEQAIISRNNLLTTIAWKIGDRVDYALEGSVFVAGAAVQWLRDGLGLLETAGESERLARAVEDTGGVYFVPALTGLGAPHWNPHARGMISGITRATRKEHLVRAALESIAYQSYDVMKAMESDLGAELKELRADGGAVANNFLMQFQADLLGIPVVRPVVMETTALGAAFLAGLATGFYPDFEHLQSCWREEHTFYPQMDAEVVEGLLHGWSDALRRV